MKNIILVIALLILVSSSLIAEDKEDLLSINENKIIELSIKAIIKKNKNINLDDLVIESIDYFKFFDKFFEDSYSSIKDDFLNINNKVSVTFIVKRNSSTEKETEMEFKIPMPNSKDVPYIFHIITARFDVNSKQDNCLVMYGDKFQDFDNYNKQQSFKAIRAIEKEDKEDLISVNENKIIKLSKKVIIEKNKNINLDDIDIYNIQYFKFFENSYPKNNYLTVIFKVKKDSTTEKQVAEISKNIKFDSTNFIISRSIIVNLDTNGDYTKNIITFNTINKKK